MSEFINCQVLDVGQGSGQLLELYDATHTMTSCVLVDLGSELEKETAGEASAIYVVKKLKHMKKPRIEAILLSHSDSDHINLLIVLLENFDPPGGTSGKPILEVGKIYYGGARNKYKKRSTDYLTYASEYLADAKDLVNFPNGATSYFADDNEWKAFMSVEDVDLYLVSGNTTKEDVELVEQSETRMRKMADPYAINTKSLIFDCTYHDVNFILTGDATGLSLAHANQILKVSGPIAGVFMVAAPHHGSEATTLDLCGLSSDTLDKEKLAHQNLTDFVNNVSAEVLTASAERVKKFKHPSMRVLDFFVPKLSNTVYVKDDRLKPAQRHFYTAYFAKDLINLAEGKKRKEWPASANWYSIQSGANILTTLYFDAPIQDGVVYPPKPGKSADPISTNYPSLGIQWGFKVTSAGVKTVEFIENRTLFDAVPPHARPSMTGILPPIEERFRPRPEGSAPPPSSSPPPPASPALGPLFARTPWRPFVRTPPAPPPRRAPEPPDSPGGPRRIKPIP